MSAPMIDRSVLQNAVIKAALDLFDCTGAYAFKLPIPNTTPQLFITAGDLQYVDCPFCGLSTCDRIGLKRHFQNGHCDVFNDTPFDDIRTHD